MKTMWKGAIQFGLVTIPVRLYTATEDRSVGFHQLHEADMGRIRYRRVCTVCGEEVPYEDIIKGYEVERGRYVPLTEQDLEAIPVPSSRTIDIHAFVDTAEVDPIYFDRPYYLAPEEIGAKPYQLLRRVLHETGRAGVAKIAFRNKEHLSLVRPLDEVLVIETMRWPDEIRPAPTEELRDDVQIRDQELQMATSLIENLTEEWNPEAYADEYREALMEVIEKKAAGETVEPAAEPDQADVIDLMDALKASVEAAERKRAEAEGAPESTGYAGANSK